MNADRSKEFMLKLLPRLDSDNDAVILETVHKINHAMIKAKYDWRDIVSVVSQNMKNPRDRHKAPWRGKVDQLLNEAEDLTDREIGFLKSMRVWKGDASFRQIQYIDDIYGQYEWTS